MMSLKACFLFAALLSVATLTNGQSGFFKEKNRSKDNPAHNLSEAIKITDLLIDKLIKDNEVPSLVFGISVRNKTIHSRAHGLLDMENKVSTHIDAVYRMCSVTKTFTSLILGRLVDQGKVNYDDSIYAHLPPGTLSEKIVNGTRVNITVGQTLSMMAG